jgi:hypothetical protein
MKSKHEYICIYIANSDIPVEHISKNPKRPKRTTPTIKGHVKKETMTYPPDCTTKAWPCVVRDSKAILSVSHK